MSQTTNTNAFRIVRNLEAHEGYNGEDVFIVEHLPSEYAIVKNTLGEKWIVGLEEMIETDNKMIYETGAKTRAVNDLILFTDNTKELAEMRDKVYAWIYEKGITPQKSHFNVLMGEAIVMYKKEFPKSHKHMNNMNINKALNFTGIYAKRFSDWKLNRGYK